MLRIVHTSACFARFSHSAFALHDLACNPSRAHALWSPIWTLFKRAGVRRDGRHGHRLAALAAHPGLGFLFACVKRPRAHRHSKFGRAASGFLLADSLDAVHPCALVKVLTHPLP